MLIILWLSYCFHPQPALWGTCSERQATRCAGEIGELFHRALRIVGRGKAGYWLVEEGTF